MKRRVVLAAAVLVAGCGTTVPMTSATGVPGGDGLTPPSDSVLVPSGGPTQGGLLGGPGARPSGSVVPGPDGRTPEQALPSLAPGASGRGFTASRILIGVATSSDTSSFGRTLGLDVAFGDPRAQVEAIVRDLNRRGGIHGRRIEVVYHDVSSTEANSDASTAAKAACTDWTQDHKVYAVVSAVAAINGDELYRCLQEAKTPVVVTDAQAHTLSEFERYRPYVYAPGVMAIEHLVPTWVPRLEATGYFSPWDTARGAPGTAPVRIGLMHAQGARGDAFAREVKRELAKLGRKVHVEFQGPSGTAGLSQASNAVLQMQSGKVTHLFSDASVLFLAPVAESQLYRPRYAITSWDAPAFSATTLRASGHEAQLHGARGVGYLPTNDVDAREDPGDVSPAVARCRKLMKEAGQDTASSRTTWYLMLISCEQLTFVERALAFAGGLTDTALPFGADRLAGRFPPLVTFRDRFDGGRLDGAAAVRDLSYRTDCQCFAYDSKENHAA